MTLPVSDTLVTYPAAQTAGAAVVLHTEIVIGSQLIDDGQTSDGGKLAVLLDVTPCHPVDAGWPDQGPDRAVIRILAAAGGQQWPVLDCVVAATNGQKLFIGAAIPVSKDTEGWSFVVAHLLPAEAQLPEGTVVEVVVDAGHRAALSAGHTACHAASLALNRAMAPRWSKETRADALGSPDFDAAAIASSTIQEHGSVDVFRLNKSLRRKGFTVEGLTGDLAAVSAAVNATLANWVLAGSPVRIERDGDALTDRRYWVCSLPDGEARIACGGTHVASLAELGGLYVDLTAGEDQGTAVLRMVTTAGSP
ncbi:metal-dependent hydrolase [Arthrobacter sp. H14-L1]|uniref:metal-dependent hydrolase n=1 Tax=Arthrobacter sp. H14-L1 TaxID=2996697 RepID=UPI00226DE8D8|nr:metal-dependent hydrolase [Arthrobacter sp. H14-L1]MCY0903403.1 metal-dependent hydrolase [Arthrobacter sp. H14-L1]